MARAHAAVLTGPRKIEMRDFALPEIGPDDGLLRVEANGLCGTDYDQYLCEFKIGGFGKVPIIPGTNRSAGSRGSAPRPPSDGRSPRAIA
jgi:D-arabinose 1-dehydrogenase-like Zn-dependent alcohol dehydrogenase